MSPFVNRDAELGLLADHARALEAGTGATVVVCGEPGMGASSLLGRWLADGVDARVLEVRGIESESELPFAGLGSLLLPLLDLIDELPEPQPAALRAALALGPVTGHDRFTVFVAVTGLLGRAARLRPLLVAVDDAHHLDPSSLAAVAFASRRLGHDGVLVVLAGRADAFDDDSFGHASTIELRPVADAHAQMILNAAARVSIHPVVSRRLVDAAGGNPAALVDLAVMLGTAELQGTRPLMEPLPVGPTFEGALIRQLADLPSATRRAMLVIAVGDEDGDDAVFRALAADGLGIDHLVPAERSRFLVLDGGRHRFRDERTRSAVYHASSAPDRRRAHQVMADVLDPGSATWAVHAAEASVIPDETIAAALERMAVDAAAVGDIAVSWHAWERAASVSLQGGDRSRRLLGATDAALRVGRPDAARRLLDELGSARPDDHRGERDLLRGRLLVIAGRPDEAATLFVARSDQLSGDDPVGAAALLLEVVPAMLRNGRVGTAVTLARRSSDLLASTPDGPLTARAAVALGSALVTIGGDRSGRELLDRYRDVAALEGWANAASFLADTAALALIRLGDHQHAREILNHLAAAIGEASAPFSAPNVLAVQSFLDYRTGRLADAAAAASSAVQIADETNQPGLVAFPLGTLATVQAMRGFEQECRDASVRLARLGQGQDGGRGHELVARAALGLLELGLGRPQRAVAELEPLWSDAHRSRPSVVMWNADFADALIRSGRPDDAEPVIADLEAAAQRSGDGRARAAATRLRALVGPTESRDELLEIAVAACRELDLPFGLARSLLDLGAAQRRSRRRKDARVSLREALACFESMSSTSWSRLAAAELDRCGGTSHSTVVSADPLTPQERQVARLVAEGASNREVASRLFVSVRTVESHLSRVYRKMDLRSRTELAGWISRTDLGHRSTPAR